MKIIGLAGGSGTGKGTVCNIFKKYNFASIDTDAVYHEITSQPESPCLIALKNEFGEAVISNDGILDRKELGKIVFASDASEKRKKLNEIAHFYVLDEVRRRIPVFASAGFCALLVDAPLLFESGFYIECDFVVSVISKKETRIERIIARDGITREMAEARIAAQLDDEYLIKKSDYILYNNETLTELEDQIKSLVHKLKNNKKEI